jgi:hypothetical protein
MFNMQIKYSTMKKIIFVLGLAVFFAGHIIADIIPVKYKSVPCCSVIQNADSFQGVSLVMVVESVMGLIHKNVVIKSSDCLNKGYSLNNSSIYALNSAYIESVGIDNIDYSKDKNALVSNIQVPALKFQYVDEVLPISNIEMYYRVVGFTDALTIIYLSKTVIKFNNGQPDSVTLFSSASSEKLKSSIEIITGKQEITKPVLSLLYPSPGQKELYFYYVDDRIGAMNIDLYDISGHKLSEYNLFKDRYELKKTLDINMFKSGIYCFRYSIGNFSETRFFLKE